MATIKDVARLAGVSVATVSYVINKTKPVAPETAARVYKAIETLDYHPHAVAQSLRKRNAHVVGVMVSDITNPFFATLLRGVEDVAREQGYSVIICNTSENPENERLYLELFSRRRMDGLLLAPTGSNVESIRKIVQKQPNIVFIDRIIPSIPVSAVLSKNKEGAYLATSYLIGQGHKRIGIVLGLPNLTTTEERLEGYRMALYEHGLKHDPELEVYGYSRISEAREACLKLLSAEAPPTAIFATNNFMTIGVIQALHQLRLRCPEDVSVVGFDDFEWAEAFVPPLTTVAQAPYKMGREAALLLFRQLRKELTEPVQVRLEVELKIRGSVAPPSRSKGGD